MNSPKLRKRLLPLAIGMCGVLAGHAGAAVYVQCPGDSNGDAIPEVADPAVACKHLSAGDGFSTMADGKVLYTFGFSDLTGVLPAAAVNTGLLAANFSAPTIDLKEGQRFYLTLTNVGMAMRPDLFDPHTVHFHGFPQAAPVFDGMPEGSFGVNMGSSVTYFYNINEPGTYMYHCHMEATEHMQMGMLGNLLRAAGAGRHVQDLRRQDLHPVRLQRRRRLHRLRRAPSRCSSARWTTSSTSCTWRSSRCPSPNMQDTYAMLNGRGYPDTVNPDPLPTPTVDGASVEQRPPVAEAQRADHGDGRGSGSCCGCRT